VSQPVEAQDLGELADPPGVPARVGRALALGRAHRSEDALLLHELEEVCVPRARVVVGEELLLALGFEEPDGLAHDLRRALVGIGAFEVVRVEQDHGVSSANGGRRQSNVDEPGRCTRRRRIL
jgi:hypothetical protein